MTNTSAGVKRPRRERGSISVEQILCGAFEVADEVSVDNLSMPLLARKLGVGVTSIYWYFRRKDELLDAMTAQVVEQVGITAPPVDPEKWRESLAHQAKTVRKSFRESPILCDLVLFRNTYEGMIGEAAMQATEQAVSALAAAGFDPSTANTVYQSVATHVRGAVILQRIQEKSAYAHPSREDGVDPETMPLIASSHRGIRLGIADDATFEYVLGCLLDRAEELIAG